MRLSIIALALGVGSAACDSPGGRATGQSTAPGGDVVVASDTRNPAADQTTSPNDDGDPAVTAVCERWNADRAARDEGRWTGSVTGCDAGDLEEPGRENTLRQVNLFRWLAGLPAVSASEAKNEAAQACALIMHANNDIQHVVPESWRCWNALGDEAAGLSNLATTPAVEGVDLYMSDEGVANLGHRRWVLSNSLGPIGIGSTSRYSCLHVIGGSGRANALYTAWPPAGIVPYEAMMLDVSWGQLSVDRAGWSVQSDRIDLRDAEVTVTRDGQTLPIRVRELDSGYGSTFGLGFVPDGWATEPGVTYRVVVVTDSEELEWTTRVVRCEP